MAAGQGFKTFATGDVLSASDVNGYLMQGVLVFADATERNAEITSPQEGQFAYLKDTNVTTYYTGSAWANLDTTGMTNPMTTTGDTIYSSSGSTPARLGIGSTGQVLTVAGGVPSWATPASAGSLAVAQISTSSSISGATFSITGLSSYDYLQFKFGNVGWATSGGWLQFTFNSDTSSKYTFQRTVMVRNQAIVLPTMVTTNNTDTSIGLSNATIPFSNSPSGGYGGILTLTNCKATGFTSFELQYNWGDNIGTEETTFITGIYQSAAAISSVQISNTLYSLTQGNYTLWGA